MSAALGLFVQPSPLPTSASPHPLSCGPLLTPSADGVRLHVCVWRVRVLGHVRVAACVHHVDEQDGRTPVWTAAQKGHVEVVQALIAGGADLNHATKVGVARWVMSCCYVTARA
jgi:hypothetical protein